MSKSYYMKEYLLGLTVGELRKSMADFPDHAEILILQSEHMTIVREVHHVIIEPGMPGILLTNHPTKTQHD
jgi:hypothetical protein